MEMEMAGLPPYMPNFQRDLDGIWREDRRMEGGKVGRDGEQGEGIKRWGKDREFPGLE
jgi:hypothetical protein